MKFSAWTLWFVNISQTKLFKLLSVHEYTHQMQSSCERKKIHGTVPLTKVCKGLYPNFHFYPSRLQKLTCRQISCPENGHRFSQGCKGKRKEPTGLTQTVNLFIHVFDCFTQIHLSKNFCTQIWKLGRKEKIISTYRLKYIFLKYSSSCCCK